MGKNKGGKKQQQPDSDEEEKQPAQQVSSTQQKEDPKKKKKAGGWKAQLEEEEKQKKAEQERLLAIKNKIKFVRARHILHEDENIVKQIHSQIKNEHGDKPPSEVFAKFAEEKSQCPSSSKGGLLGYFGKGQMDPAFEEVAFKTPVGNMSGTSSYNPNDPFDKNKKPNDGSPATNGGAKSSIVDGSTSSIQPYSVINHRNQSNLLNQQKSLQNQINPLALEIQQNKHLNMDFQSQPSSIAQTIISDEYTMESTLFDYDKLRKNPEESNFFIKRYNQGSIYKGQCENGKRHGLGVMIYYDNQRVYEGQWEVDKRSGRGYERYKNGNIYEGEFLDNKANGRGIYKWKKGEIYDGEWLNGKKQGHGVWRGIHGDCYIGEWNNSLAEGYGVHVWKNGDKYEGEWVNCLKHGQGTDLFGNGDSYQGQYKFGKPDGFGQYKWSNGSFYIGELQNGLKHGKGKWKKNNLPNCNQYEGDYQMDKKHGFGVFNWESGNVFKGSYKDDLRDGFGEMFWTDGSTYKGDWVKGVQHGHGILTLPDGSIKDGPFENNIFMGKTKYPPSQKKQSTIQEDIDGEENQQTIKQDASYEEKERAPPVKLTLPMISSAMNHHLQDEQLDFINSKRKPNHHHYTNRLSDSQSLISKSVMQHPQQLAQVKYTPVTQREGRSTDKKTRYYSYVNQSLPEINLKYNKINQYNSNNNGNRISQQQYSRSNSSSRGNQPTQEDTGLNHQHNNAHRKVNQLALNLLIRKSKQKKKAIWLPNGYKQQSKQFHTNVNGSNNYGSKLHNISVLSSRTDLYI
eukprot:403372630